MECNCDNLENHTIHQENCIRSCGIYCQGFLAMMFIICMYAYCVICYNICGIKRFVTKNNDEDGDQELEIIGERSRIYNRPPPKYEDI